MTENNIHHLPTARSRTLLAVSPPILSVKPASITEITAHLSTCLALVKPVGMSAEDTQAWLRTAARELAYLPPDLLHEACQTARRTCTHHGQIVPLIVRETEERMATRRRLAPKATEPMPELPKPKPWQPTADELEAIKRQAASNLSARNP